MIVIRNTEFTLTQTVMARQRSSLISIANLKAKYLPWRSNCIPLSHFRRLFPQLCKTDGLPKETALEPTLAQFEAYNGGIMQAHGWTIMPIPNISTKKFHPVRYYVVEREDARILISHATASWLGLVKVMWQCGK